MLCSHYLSPQARQDFSVSSSCRCQFNVTAPKLPLDLSHHFSRVTLARKPSEVKKFYEYFLVPGIENSNLAAGSPHPSFFPYDIINTQIARPDRFNAAVCDKPKSNTSGAVVDLNQTIEDLPGTLEYGTAEGYPPLRSFLRQFTRECMIRDRDFPYIDGPDVIPTCGNTDGFSQVLQMFTNTWSEGHDDVREREGLLCEQFTFMNAIQTALPRGLQIVPVTVDAEGLLATGEGSLEDVLSNWNNANGKRPHLLYIIPTGQNPTGAISSIKRRKEVYAVCSRFDVLIIEDDPCWHLQFPSAAHLEAAARGLPQPPEQQGNSFLNSPGTSYIDSLVPSYINIDVEGRVIRLDTFSKTIAPGCRLGWITAQPTIIKYLLRITETSTAQPSGFVQAMVTQLLVGSQPIAKREFARRSEVEQESFNGWKVDDWTRWLQGVRGRYESRMNRMCTILEEMCLPESPTKKIYTFSWPRGGMSVWIRMHFHTHPLAGQVTGPALAHAMWMFLMQKPQRVLVTPGSLFSPTAAVKDEHGWKYFRLCFATVSEEEVEGSSRRFIRAAKLFWAITSKKQVEEIEAVDPFGDSEGK